MVQINRFKIWGVRMRYKPVLEYIFPAPLSVCEGKGELIWTQHGLHHTVNIDLITGDHSITKTRWLLPLYRYVLEVTGPVRNRYNIDVIRKSLEYLE